MTDQYCPLHGTGNCNCGEAPPSSINHNIVHRSEFSREELELLREAVLSQRSDPYVSMNDKKVKRLESILNRLERLTTLPYPESPGKTHWEECWKERGHHNCAVARAEALERQLNALREGLNQTALRVRADQLGGEVCPCGDGIDTDGDGDCLRCAQLQADLDYERSRG